MRTLFALILLSTSPAYAQLHGGDIELQVTSGKIVSDAQVYSAEFGEIIPNEVDEPGFDSQPATFPIGSSVGFSILDSLRVWDGTDFDAIPAETLSIRFGSSLGPITTPSIPNNVDGFNLNVASDGSWHRHFDFLLNAPASTGIYLLQLQLDSSAAAIAASDPFFIVFNQNDSEFNHDAAIAFAEGMLTVHEPSAWAMSCVLAVLALRGRLWKERLVSRLGH
jgi:hypothetical protein